VVVAVTPPALKAVPPGAETAARTTATAGTASTLVAASALAATVAATSVLGVAVGDVSGMVLMVGIDRNIPADEFLDAPKQIQVVG
jgi:hypothetical protein